MDFSDLFNFDDDEFDVNNIMNKAKKIFGDTRHVEAGDTFGVPLKPQINFTLKDCERPISINPAVMMHIMMLREHAADKDMLIDSKKIAKLAASEKGYYGLSEEALNKHTVHIPHGYECFFAVEEQPLRGGDAENTVLCRHLSVMLHDSYPGAVAHKSVVLGALMPWFGFWEKNLSELVFVNEERPKKKDVRNGNIHNIRMHFIGVMNKAEHDSLVAEGWLDELKDRINKTRY